MAATITVPHRMPARVSGAHGTASQIKASPILPRHGVITLWGYGINVSVDKGHLILRDGVGDERRAGRFARVNHGIRRLVVIGADGSVSLAALRWLADQDASFVMLERDGTVLLTTGPVSASDARLRRAQACVSHSDSAVSIVRELIRLKLSAQEEVARDKMRDTKAAETIAGFRAQLDSAPDILGVRTIEGQGGQAYWSAWRDIKVEFPRSELPRIPDHWKTFGGRQSPLTRSPRVAVNPANAVLNYLYALLESETRLAIASLGLDPGMGLLHFDTATRDSLACDLMEPVRSKVDAYLLDWISRSSLKREWFFEKRDGNCRLMPAITSRLSETIPTWRREIAPLVEWFADSVAASASTPGGLRGPGTRLTQRRWREATGYTPSPAASSPKPQNACRICGVPISKVKTYCPKCVLTVASEQMSKVQAAGAIAANLPESREKQGETQRRHNVARRAWQPSELPDWLNAETYLEKVQPLLAGFTRPAIAAALDVSIKYAGDVRAGACVPHPRHWVKLAKLVGVANV